MKPSSTPLGEKKKHEFFPKAVTLDVMGCLVQLRAVNGPEAHEVFLSCQPPAALTDAGLQSEAIYQAIEAVLNRLDSGFRAIVRETVFHRNLQRNRDVARAARERVLAESAGLSFPFSAIEIEQPPVDERNWIEVSVEAVIPVGAKTEVKSVVTKSACDCLECNSAQGILIHSNDTTRLYSGSLYGRGENAYEQTHTMFEAAEKMLQQAGLEFSDVMRTWLYLPEMERDYPQLNKARREFFEQRNIDPIPASTGIGAGLASMPHDLCLVVYAVKQTPKLVRSVMTTPTLNEAPQYGADFSRGMRVAESNKEALYVSGTASLNEAGKSVFNDDFDAQVKRMLVNVAALLKEQGANFADIAYAYTYCKYASDVNRLIEKFDEAGYSGFVNTLVEAPVCRPELLCETEVVAIVNKTHENN